MGNRVNVSPWVETEVKNILGSGWPEPTARS